MTMKNNSTAGFTLIELIIVVSIMSIIAGAAVPIASKALTYHARKSTIQELELLGEATLEHFADTFVRPTDIEDLVVDGGTTGWAGPYLPGVVTDQLSGNSGYEMDAWSRAYRIVHGSGDVLTIESMGQDALWGSSDDLSLQLDCTPLRREETQRRLDIINAAVLRYNAHRGGDPADQLPAGWTSARLMLITNGYLPNDSTYQTDAWGTDFVEDPIGNQPVVLIQSTNIN